jgi:enoyl-CoA hydratase/carnithine racemase
MSSLVLVDKPRPHVAQVTLNAPDRLNAMSFALV